MLGKVCWVVKEAVLQEHNMADKVKIPNDWEYILEKPKRASLTPAAAQPMGSSPSGTPKRVVDGADMTSGEANSGRGSPTSTAPAKPKEKKRVSIQTLFKSMSEKKGAAAAAATTTTPKEPSKDDDEPKQNPQ